MSKAGFYRLTAVMLFLVFGAADAAAQTKGLVKISAVRAQLFYEDKGTFSKDIFSDKNFDLWNTGAGEGSAEGPSKATLVTVEVSGGNASPDNLKLEIAATGKANRVIQKKVFDVFIYQEVFKFYAAVWVADTPCEPVKITAKLVGKGAAVAPVVKTIAFACGE
ncbi:MAG: hypothetical protein M3T96_04615 [Acidobacteriota bacterium]|nr:hypothetical protein [Acidobacteriota bacterium]